MSLPLAALVAVLLLAPAAEAAHPNPVSRCVGAVCAHAGSTVTGAGSCEAGSPYRQETNGVALSSPQASASASTTCFAHSYFGPQTRGSTVDVRASAAGQGVRLLWTGYSGAVSGCHAAGTVTGAVTIGTGNLPCPAGPPPAVPGLLTLLP